MMMMKSLLRASLLLLVLIQAPPSASSAAEIMVKGYHDEIHSQKRSIRGGSSQGGLDTREFEREEEGYNPNGREHKKESLTESSCDPTSQASSCPAGEYCFLQDGECLDAEAVGVCKAIAYKCHPMSIPVCGCDGKTHTNACLANRDGINIAHSGACGTEIGLVGGGFEVFQ